MIYTSYFGNKILKPYPICIARYCPKYAPMPIYRRLCPTEKILNLYKSRKINERKYAEIYINDILAKLNPNDVVNEIKETLKVTDFTFCCYEKSSDFCHRHIVKEWINKYADYQVLELTSPYRVYNSDFCLEFFKD